MDAGQANVSYFSYHSVPKLLASFKWLPDYHMPTHYSMQFLLGDFTKYCLFALSTHFYPLCSFLCCNTSHTWEACKEHLQSFLDISVSCSVMPDSLRPLGLQPTRFLVHEIFQARILEWVAISFSRGSSQFRDRNQHLLYWRANSLPLSHLGSPR